MQWRRRNDKTKSIKKKIISAEGDIRFYFPEVDTWT